MESSHRAGCVEMYICDCGVGVVSAVSVASGDCLRSGLGRREELSSDDSDSDLAFASPAGGPGPGSMQQGLKW
jgi:hypothetical protein